MSSPSSSSDSRKLPLLSHRNPFPNGPTRENSLPPGLLYNQKGVARSGREIRNSRGYSRDSSLDHFAPGAAAPRPCPSSAKLRKPFKIRASHSESRPITAARAASDNVEDEVKEFAVAAGTSKTSRRRGKSPSLTRAAHASTSTKAQSLINVVRPSAEGAAVAGSTLRCCCGGGGDFGAAARTSLRQRPARREKPR